MSRGAWLFTQKDVKRAFKAAFDAGLTEPRVDILRDGTIRISQMPPQEAVEAPKPAPADAEPRDPRLRSWD
jgi:hypothetical protein